MRVYLKINFTTKMQTYLYLRACSLLVGHLGKMNWNKALRGKEALRQKEKL